VMGFNLGQTLVSQEVAVTADLVVQGLRDGLSGGNSMFTEEEMQAVMEQLQQETAAKQQARAAAAEDAPVETPAPVDTPTSVDPPAPAPVVTPAPVAAVDPTTTLALHNTVRQTVAASESARLGQTVTIPDLTWNAEAAALAQAWADHLLATDTFNHNSNRGPFGENLYWETGSDPATGAERALGSWAAEQAAYTWDTNSCSDVCGHYTLVVWANVSSVGCGAATDGTQTYWVCNYAPPGNLSGQRPYEPAAARRDE
jgi:hypothetical protein